MKLLSTLISAAFVVASFSASADNHATATAPAKVEEHKHDAREEHKDATKAEHKANKEAEKAAKKSKEEKK